MRLTTDVERRVDGFRARVRWTDPLTKKRVGRVSHVRTAEEVEEFFDQMRKATETGTNTAVTLAAYAASIGDRWKRGLDPTSTAENYDIGLRLRVLPALGHIQVVKITAGMIDRTNDQWETEHSASTIKNSIAPLVRVLDEAVRDDIITANTAKHRARRNLGKHVTQTAGALRAHAIPDLATLRTLADACGQVHQSYSDHVMLSALLAARGSEVADLRVGDVDWRNRVVKIERQHYPDKGGRVIKQTKGRRALRADPRRSRTHPRTPHHRPEARRSAPAWPTRRGADDSDGAGCDELGQDRREPRPARSRPSRAPPHGCNVDGRRRRPTARAPRDSRARLDGDHPRVFPPRRPTSCVRCGAGECVPLTVGAEAPERPHRVVDATAVRGGNDPRNDSGPLSVPLFTGQPISTRSPAPKRQLEIGQGDQRRTNKKPASRNDEALMKLASHQGFSVGLTGFESATP